MNLGVQNDHRAVLSITKQSEHTARTGWTCARTQDGFVTGPWNANFP